MTSRIAVHGISGTGRHGWFDWEQEQGQRFVVDVDLDVDTSVAAASDDLADTVDYGQVASRVHELVTGPPFRLVETLAERVAEACLADPGVSAATVTVHKPEAPVGVPFDDVTLTVTRAAARPVALALGSNLDDRAAHLAAAVRALSLVPGLTLDAVSPVYETDPVVLPGAEPQQDYLNAVVVGTTSLSPDDLLAAAHVVEAAAGRVRAERWGPRPLDVDLLVVGDVVADHPDLTLPHPRAHLRAFVLAPWADVAPDHTVPGHGRVADLLAVVGRDGVRPVTQPDLAAVLAVGR